ncbi:cupin-like domain-containing protein [Pseudoxanthomonas sacheonensis]|uniref:cupin-like domain-containing protein n=1 Tax=Pseudoxanthomonas sacheonensis TaxID=443615 RepID=UPI0013D67139|nr:cupin-like domain-containing protein [Pseudoxanthomonas sacheonensis]KAF1711831.1 transcription factor [Pseudoxanthomonas sacheonensis]
MPSAIEESHVGDRAFTQADLADRELPLVIRGLCRDWPVVAAARESDTSFAHYLAGFDNGAEVDTLLMAPEEDGVIGYNPQMDGFNYRHFRVPVTEALRRLAAYSRHDGVTSGVALQSAPVSACLPGFRQEHPLPQLQAAIEPRLWIGNRVTTPAHFDASHNLAVVVCGRRRFTLFAPEQVGDLYIGPLDFAPTGAAISMARLDRPDDPRFPRLRQALAQSLVSELEPGDAIYIPPLWWHHVASLERLNALVNYWWKPAIGQGVVPESGLGALMHAILALKSLPRSERKAWKHLFDHYVFDDHDPAAHIPAERRNLLGRLTPALVEQIKGKIRSYL